MRYLTIAECFEEDAKRHEINAARHILDGHPDYALGSLRKAAKWRAKKEIFCMPPMPPFLDEAYAITKNNMARLLFQSVMK